MLPSKEVNKIERCPVKPASFTRRPAELDTLSLTRIDIWVQFLKFTERLPWDYYRWWSALGREAHSYTHDLPMMPEHFVPVQYYFLNLRGSPIKMIPSAIFPYFSVILQTNAG